MKQSKLSLKKQGVRGGSPTWEENTGSATLHIDRDGKVHPDYISVDAFCGSGKTYKRRKECEIEINREGEALFRGTFDELCKRLKPATKTTDREVEIASHYLCDDENTIEQQIAIIRQYAADKPGNECNKLSWVEGVTVWQPLEDTLTVREFLESI